MKTYFISFLIKVNTGGSGHTTTGYGCHTATDEGDSEPSEVLDSMTKHVAGEYSILEKCIHVTAFNKI